MLLIRKPWDSQPQEAVGVDWGNPITRGLLVSLPLSTTGGFQSLGQNAITGSPTGVTTGVTPKGTAAKFSGSGSQITLGTACLLPTSTTPFTLTLYELPDATSEYSSLVGLSGGVVQWLWIRGTNGSYYCAVGRSNSGAVQNFNSVGTQVAGVGRRFLLTSPGGVDGLTGYRLWMDGVEQTSGSTAYGSLASGTNYIGWDGSDTRFNGKIQDFNLWGRILTDAEIAEYFANPWQLFSPRSIWVPVSAGGPAGYTLTADAATFTLTGNAAALRAGRKLTATPASYAWTAQDASLLHARRLSAAVAEYTLTGNAATLKAARVLSAAAGSYAWTGNDATLSKSSSYAITADAASYAWTGQDAALRAARRLAATPASYAFTGNDATLTYTPVGAYSLTADTAAYALTGNAAGVRADHRLNAAAGIYNLTGSAASLLRGYRLAATVQAYAWTGSDATLTRTNVYRLTAAGGAYVWTGNAATLTYSGYIDTNSAWWTYSVAADNLTFAIPADNLTYAVGADQLAYEIGV